MHIYLIDFAVQQKVTRRCKDTVCVCVCVCVYGHVHMCLVVSDSLQPYGL